MSADQSNKFYFYISSKQMKDKITKTIQFTTVSKTKYFRTNLIKYVHGIHTKN